MSQPGKSKDDMYPCFLDSPEGKKEILIKLTNTILKKLSLLSF